LVVPDQDAAATIERVEPRFAPASSPPRRPDRALRPPAAASGGALIRVVQSAEDRDSHDLARAVPLFWLPGSSARHRA